MHRETEELAAGARSRANVSVMVGARAGGAWAGWDGSGPDTYGRSMRTVFSGGAVFDGSGGGGGRCRRRGRRRSDRRHRPGLDGDAAVDCSGRTIVPGFIDSHVHFMSDGNLDLMSSVVTPFSLNFYLAAERMARTLAAGVTTVREAGGSISASRRRRRAASSPAPAC